MQVAILGPLEVHDDGGAPVALPGARLRGLIARLALAGGQPVSTGALSEAVWDHALPADVANALQTLISRARRALGEPAAVEQSAAGYRLAVAPDDVDALRFERLVAEGAVAEALALWRGPALADAGDFAEPFARRLEDLRLDATVTFLTRELDAGRAAARVGEVETLVAAHPLDEKLTGLLMRALAATGRQADALAAYEALLAHSPRLRIVATSREPLGITGESLFVVPPLDEAPAARLFADRATAVRPDFTLDDETRPLVTDIVHRLDGLPLAIELAAARLRTLPLAEISSRLTDRFRLLTGGSRTALPRHRTLRAVVEWSWELLTPAERLLAERFSVFPAGATPAAAAAVCAGGGFADGEPAPGEVDELLSSLVDKSLLQPLADGTRLRMLETIREYGAEQLAGRAVGGAPELAGLRRRHAAHYSALMSDAAPRLLTRDQMSSLAVLRADHGNILAALRYWCDADEAENAVSLAVSLSILALLLGNDSETAQSMGEALAVPGPVDEGLRTIGEALHTITSVMDPALGGKAAAAAYPGLADRLDAIDIDQYPVAGILRPVYAMFVNDDERLPKYLEQARGARDEWLAAASWMMTAGAAENEGNIGETRAAAAEALARFRVLGERWGLATALQTIATIRVFDGDLDGAVAAYAEAVRLLAEIGHNEDTSLVQLRLAELAARRGDMAKARELSTAARSAAEADGSPIGQGMGTAWWAAFEVTWGDLDTARPFYEAAEQHLALFGPAHPAREHLEALVAATGARIALADKDLRAAGEQAARCYRAAVAAQDMPVLAQASGALAELAVALGQPERAVEILAATTVARGGDDPTDPTVVRLAPLLRAALGEDRYNAAYASGMALDRAEAIKRLDPTTVA